MKEVPSVLLDTDRDHQGQHRRHVIKDGFLKPDQICTGKYAKACADAGIQ